MTVVLELLVLLFVVFTVLGAGFDRPRRQNGSTASWRRPQRKSVSRSR